VLIDKDADRTVPQTKTNYCENYTTAKIKQTMLMKITPIMMKLQQQVHRL